MNIKPKIYQKLLTIKLEPELFANFKKTVGEKNMSLTLRGFIKEFLVKKEDEENEIESSVSRWLQDLQEKEDIGEFDIKKDPIYQISGYESDAP